MTLSLVTDVSPVLAAASRLVDPCGQCGTRHLSVCMGVDEQFLAQLAAVVTTVHLPAHGMLASEGDEAACFFNITSGAVKLYKLLPDGRQQIVGFLFAGDFIGLAVRDTYAYSVEAIGPTTACRFERRKFEGLLERFPNMAFRLRERASDELAIAQEQMLSLGRKSAKERMASFLLQLSRRAESLGAVGQSDRPAHDPCRHGRLSGPDDRNRQPDHQPAQDRRHHHALGRQRDQAGWREARRDRRGLGRLTAGPGRASTRFRPSSLAR